MKITPEIAERINTLYQELGVKTQVAKIIGCSPATVTKYLKPVTEVKEQNFSFMGEVKPVEEIFTTKITYQEIVDRCVMTQENWAELKEFQKEL